MVDPLELFFQLGTTKLACVSTGQQIFFDRQMTKAVTAFHDLRQATLDQGIRRKLIDALTVEFNATLGHVTTLAAQQCRDGFQCGRFASAVRSHQRHDFAAWYRERDAFQHQDDMVINHLDVINGEDGRSRHVIRCCVFSDISSWTPA